MKLTKILAGAVIAASITTTAAQATTVSIDFTALASGTTVTNQYANVTFSLAGGLASGAPQIAYYGEGLSNSPTAGEYPTADSLVATFTTPVSGVSFSFNNEGYNGANNYRVYSPTAVLLTSGALDGNGRVFYALAESNIGSIVWSNGLGTSGNWTQALSTLSFNTGVPEPTSWALMIGGFGLVGAAMRRRAAATVAHA
jgi:hypothetical protein